MKSKTYRLIGVLLLAVLLLSLAAPALAQEPTTAALASEAGGQKAACAPFSPAEQQEFDSLTAMKAAETLAGADLARYDALAQQMSCYSAQFVAPAQAEQPRGATPAAPVAPGVCDTAGPIEVEGTIVGTTPTAYATLGAAFAAINGGTHTGAVSIDVCGDTSEGPATAILNASGSGSASYTSITMAPAGGAARMISGATTAGSPLIDFSGADNVTIDGLNTGGNALTIANTTASATSGTSTIRFIGGATNNTVSNSTILGSFNASVATNGGNIYFATDAVTANGNDNNTISNNNIGPAGANLPTKGVYSNGSTTTTAINNSGNVVTNNNIYDYFGAAVTSAGVYIADGSTDFTISNNKFYQTATRTQTAGAQHSSIWIANASSGNNFQVTGNIIGYASSAGTGTYSFVGNGAASKLIAIYLNVAATTASSVQGNTITAINISGVTGGTGTGSAFMGISVVAGLVNIGNVTGNTIGSLTVAGAIALTNTTTTAFEVYGVYYFPSTTANISNNSVGGITTSNSGSAAITFYVLRAWTGSSVTNTFANNTLGSAAAPISVSASSTSSRLIGLFSQTGVSVVTGNTISNMTMNSAHIGTGSSASLIGLWSNNTSATIGNNIAQNTIYALSNTAASAAVWVTGLHYNGSTTGTHLVQRNLIYGLTTPSTSATATVNGIYVHAGATTYRNNMIALGADMTANSPQINGINETVGTDNFYFNSVYIGGAGVAAGTANSFAFNSAVTTNTRAYRNNIFYNARSNGGATGKHYALQVGGTAPNPAGLTTNNNVLYAPGTGGYTGRFNSLDQATLANWQTATGQDANSFASDPQYQAPAAATPDLHINPSVATVIEGNGFLIASVTDDFDGQTRASLTPVDIGADAGNFIGIDLTGPTITYTPLGNTISVSNRAFNNVTITDASGVNTSAGAKPRVYYKRATDGNVWNDNTSGSDGWKYAEANGVTSPFDFTIDYSLLNGGTGVSAGVTVQYFVVAQDLAATPNIAINSGAFAAAPSSVALTAAAFPIGGAINSYLISQAFSGTYTVPGSYPSLTNTGGIFEALNLGVFTGNVVIEITADLTGELGTHALNQWAEDGVGGYTMLIKPSGAPRTVTGTNAGALIRLNGADRVTINGSTTGALADAVGGNPALRELTIQNTNTGTAAVVIAVQSGAAGAQNNTIKNVNVLGQDPTTTLAGIALGGNTPGTVGTDNDGNRVENCSVKRAIYGIYSAGQNATNPNTGTVITQNDLSATTTDRIRRIGIVVFYEDGVQITENSVGGINTNEAADAIGIGLGTQGMDTTLTTSGGITNAFVSRNKVNGVNSASTTGFSAAGIAVAGAAGGANTIVNNMITGVTAPSTSPDLVAGIYVVGATGSSTRLYYNSVSMTGDRGTVATQMPSYGLAVTGADPTLTLRNNIFYTTQIASGGGAAAESYAVGMVTATFANLDSNYNAFYSSGANAGGFRTGSLAISAGTDHANLAAWQAAVADDVNSIEADPVFVNPASDLHITGPSSPVSNAGAVIAGITIDIDGDTRSTVSPDIGADEFMPLAVTLASFTAQGFSDRVLVEWMTVSEYDNAGFNLYRSDSAAGPQALLAYLPSQGPGSTQGYAYSYDDLDVQPGETWWYWLEDVSLSGATTLHGPVSATVSAPTAVTLSSVSASPAAGAAAVPLAGALLALLAPLAAAGLRRRA